jgi:hypothetical protein
MAMPPEDEKDIGGGLVRRPFSHNDKQFEWGQKLTRDEVLAIPLSKRRALVELEDLEIYKRPRQRRHADVSVALLIEGPPPWNSKAPTALQNSEMRAWIEKTLTVLFEHAGAVEYEGAMRGLHQLSRLPSQVQRDIYAKWVAEARMREARYGNREPMLRAMRKRFPVSGAEDCFKEPPRQRGQKRPQRERDERDIRLLQALKYVDCIHGLFSAGRWPQAMVIEIVAAHYGLRIEEVEKARHHGPKEIKRRLRHLTN